MSSKAEQPVTAGMVLVDVGDLTLVINPPVEENHVASSDGGEPA